MKPTFEALAAREALSQLPEIAAHENLDPPELRRLYVPDLHTKALQLDASVVVGMRGAGKSWWTAVLASDSHREFISRQMRASALSQVIARVGFGLDDSEKFFPQPETLATLLNSGADAQHIWQTVVLRHAMKVTESDDPLAELSWREAVAWTANNLDEVNSLFTRCDAALASSQRTLLVVFDAFDRLSTDWATVRRLTTAALQLTLRLRSRRAIRAKLFIRPDLDEDEEVWQFPDSSKLRHGKVDLVWSSTDLYGLIIMHLGNATGGDFAATFRAETARACGFNWDEQQGVYLITRASAGDTERQRAIIEALADRTMGGGRNRGFTYTWVPLHLADAKGRISPRTYLLAFKRAAEFTTQSQSGHVLALHHSAINQGVVKASEVRVDEISEDYPWVRPLLEAARGTTVPMEVHELTARWTPECLAKMSKAAKGKLPPRRFAGDPFRRGQVDSLVDDLVELAVVYRTRDGRLNMPDIFRVGFGIRRKGGVRPPR